MQYDIKSVCSWVCARQLHCESVIRLLWLLCCWSVASPHQRRCFSGPRSSDGLSWARINRSFLSFLTSQVRLQHPTNWRQWGRTALIVLITSLCWCAALTRFKRTCDIYSTSVQDRKAVSISEEPLMHECYSLPDWSCLGWVGAELSIWAFFHVFENFWDLCNVRPLLDGPSEAFGQNSSSAAWPFLTRNLVLRSPAIWQHCNYGVSSDLSIRYLYPPDWSPASFSGCPRKLEST